MNNDQTTTLMTGSWLPDDIKDLLDTHWQDLPLSDLMEITTIIESGDAIQDELIRSAHAQDPDILTSLQTQQKQWDKTHRTQHENFVIAQENTDDVLSELENL